MISALVASWATTQDSPCSGVFKAGGHSAMPPDIFWRVNVVSKGAKHGTVVVWFSEKSLNFCHQMSAFKAKMHQIRFRLGLRPDPAGEAYSAPPELLAGFKGPTSKERGKWEGGREGEGRGKGRKGQREGRTPTAFWTNRTLLSQRLIKRHWVYLQLRFESPKRC